MITQGMGDLTMKLMLALMLVVATGSINAAQANDGTSEIKSQKPVIETGGFPGGGWDHNNLRISTASGSKLLPVELLPSNTK
jgi:hypothetical protein